LAFAADQPSNEEARMGGRHDHSKKDIGSQHSPRDRPSATTHGSSAELRAKSIPRAEKPPSWGAVKSNAAGIAYAVERNWFIISGNLHSVSLTEASRHITHADAQVLAPASQVG
jgi:hypothetical protein